MVNREHLMEVTWISATVVVLAYLGVVSAYTLVNIHTAPEGTTTIQVEGRQWSWEFIYPDGTRSTGELRVKAGEVVKLEVRSIDVIHSLFIYDMGFKIDANPGAVNRFWFKAERPGEYPIQCAEFCGLLHYAMRAKLIVE